MNDIFYKYYNTRIYDYHKLKRKEIKKLVHEIIKERRKKNFPITRTNKSYESEIIAHKRLYKLHLFRSHTIDCDLEEHIKFINKIIYYIIGVWNNDKFYFRMYTWFNTRYFNNGSINNWWWR